MDVYKSQGGHQSPTHSDGRSSDGRSEQKLPNPAGSDDGSADKPALYGDDEDDDNGRKSEYGNWRAPIRRGPMFILALS